MSTTTEKVFCLIKEGDYPILKFVFNDILKNIFKADINETVKVKEFIKTKIKKIKILFKEWNKKEYNNLKIKYMLII